LKKSSIRSPVDDDIGLVDQMSRESTFRQPAGYFGNLLLISTEERIVENFNAEYVMKSKTSP
jgi:hypothetical protein